MAYLELRDYFKIAAEVIDQDTAEDEGQESRDTARVMSNWFILGARTALFHHKWALELVQEHATQNGRAMDDGRDVYTSAHIVEAVPMPSLAAVTEALEEMEKDGLAEHEVVMQDGRPVDMWRRRQDERNDPDANKTNS